MKQEEAEKARAAGLSVPLIRVQNIHENFTTSQASISQARHKQMRESGHATISKL